MKNDNEREIYQLDFNVYSIFEGNIYENLLKVNRANVHFH